jgi:polygalacturonase
MEKTLRREFFKLAGTGLASTTLGAPVFSKEPESDKKAISTANAFFNVKTFGATGDGETLDTPAINKAIEAAAEAGGGTVYFTAGTYSCYSIHLKSNVALYIDQGATILAAETPENGTTNGYDPAESNAPWENYQDYGHNHWHNSLLWGENLHDLAILGPGLIWGKGLSRGSGTGPKAEAPGVGNKAIALKNCRNVILRDFSILKGGHFGILATGVDNLTIDNLKIDTDRDGMDIDCCRNVRVSNCSVNSPWDDAICPKSSFALGYARATENLTITNCYVTAAYELGTLLDGTFKRFDPTAKVPRTGRIKLGTESNGGFKNVTISNCVFDGCRGLALESVDGSLLEDVTITNITMRDGTNSPIFMRLGSRMRGPDGVPVGTLKRVIISNLVSYNNVSMLPCLISGIPGFDIEDVKLSDIYIHHRGGAGKDMASIDPPEFEKKYPEPAMFGPLPSHGFYIRHVKNIEMTNIKIAYEKDDARPAFLLNHVEDADFFRVKAQTAQGVPILSLKNVKQLQVSASRGLKDTRVEHVVQETF